MDREKSYGPGLNRNEEEGEDSTVFRFPEFEQKLEEDVRAGNATRKEKRDDEGNLLEITVLDKEGRIVYFLDLRNRYKTPRNIN